MTTHKIFLGFAISLVLGIGGGFSSDSWGQAISSSPSQTVRGKITKVDGYSYVVQDISGKEVKMTVDSNTMMMDGTKLKEGDTITADVTAKGQATYVIPGPPPDNTGPKGASAPPSTEVEKSARQP